nr:PREDICTED: laminin subunit alpha-2-like [Bemisia tabaci]
MWVSSSTKGVRRHWIWLVLLLSLQVVHGAEETPADNTTSENTSTTPDSSTNQNSTTQNNSNNNSTNNDCDCNCDYFMRQVTCPFDHLDNPHYDKQNDILIFIDQYVGRVCIYDPNTGCTSCTCELDEPLGSVIPLLDSCNEYIIGYGPKMAKMKWDGCCDTCPEITIISRHDKEKRGVVFNDGKADLFGHVLMNTKGPVKPNGETESGFATLYRYVARECGLKDALGKDDREDYLNGIAFNCNYTTMYMCETKKKKIYGFDYDLKTGKPSNKRMVFDYDKANEDGRPNGLTIDCCGNLWVGSQGGGKVLQVDPVTGKVMRKIPFPVRDVIALTFGGCGLDVLYVTTSRRFLTCDEKKGQPQAGSVFAVYNLCAQGLPANDACICRGGCFCSGFYNPCGCTRCGKYDKDDDDKDNNNDGNSQDKNSNNGGSESNNNDSNNSGNNTTNSNSNSCRSCGYGGKYGFRTASSGDYQRCCGCCDVCGGVGYRFGACSKGGSCGGGKSGGCNNGYGSCGCDNGYESCGCSKSCGCNNGYESCGCCNSCGSGNGYGSCGCCNSGGFNSYGLCDCGKSCGSSCGSSKGYSSCCCCKSYVKDSGTSTNNTSDGSSNGTNGSGSGCSCGNGVSGSCGGSGNGSCGSSGSCGGCGRSGCGSCGGNGGDGYGSCGSCGRGGYTSCKGCGSCSCYGLSGPCGSCGGCGSCGSSGCGGRCGSCGGSGCGGSCGSCGGSGCGGRCGSCGGSGCGGSCGSCGGSGCGGRCGSCGGSGCGGRCGSCGYGSSGNCCPSGSSGPPRGSCGSCSRGPYGSGRAGYVPGACGSCRGNGGCDDLVEGLLSVLAARKNY